ncbi:hypothetical protein Q4Q35_08095 [Flavivirga aquimarina]|uniref:Uncharacterized protein n=1 Tax=Flavivirga aquimarina TaxID=2027862 RepID=A0ABT8W9H8_9FLAO|nr:hypothetical protein [Flavivirga aquimarina]MDO5969765.1 hypothetical protein [Flavivirga aquimarina]
MADISNIITLCFVFTTWATLWFFYKTSKSKKVLFGIIIWMSIISALGISGFYRTTEVFPPRLIFLLGPGILFVLLIFLTKRGREFSDNLDLKWLTLLHVIRIPIEIILFYVFLEGLIPDLMTFEGYNFDILSGLSAPIIYYLVFIKKWIGSKGLLFWNIICLLLLINILTIAFLSAQTPFQQLAFNQPNIGVAYFPFVWLPAVIVPIVLFSHVAAIRMLFKSGL